jgi:hypothetical protein
MKLVAVYDLAFFWPLAVFPIYRVWQYKNPKDPGFRQGLMDTLLPEAHVGIGSQGNFQNSLKG